MITFEKASQDGRPSFSAPARGWNASADRPNYPTQPRGIVVLVLVLLVAISMFCPTVASGSTSSSLQLFSAKLAPSRGLGLAQNRAATVAEYNRLAESAITEGRRTGDLHWYHEAEEALRHAFSLDSSHPLTLRNAAWLSTIFHRFDRAVRFAEAVLQARPGDADAYGILCDAHLESGRYAEAEKAAQQMIDLRPGLPSYSRGAHLLWLNGETTGAISLMYLAIDSGSPRSEATAWARTQLAEFLFKTGKLDASEEQCRIALRSHADYRAALVGLGRVLAAQSRYDEAIIHYKRATSVHPSVTDLVDLFTLYTKTGETTSARVLFSAVEKTVKDREKLGFHGDELALALFYADHGGNLERATALARAEVEHHSTIQAFMALAWVQHQRGKARKAAALLDEALRLGTRDPLLYYRAAKIYAAAGERARARTALEKALEMNPQFHVQFACDARAMLDTL